MAKTCSAIGNDLGSNKLLAEKSSSASNGADAHQNKSNKTSGRSPALVVTDPKPVSFKPYEKSADKAKSASSVVSLSPTGSAHSRGSPTSPKILNGKSPSPAASAATSLSATKDSARAPSATTTTSAASTESSSSSSTTTPVIRSGMEVLAGHAHKEALGGLRFPSALDAAANPAFRPPYGGLPGFPPTSLSASVCRDPYCRDPTCPTAIYNAQLTAALSGISGLPPGYAELLQAQKLGGFGLPGLPPTSLPPSTTAAGASATATAGGPYICNWMNGREGYCGKRHTSAEELLQHLRTHTNLSTTDSASLLSGAAPSLYSPGLFGGAGSAAAAANLHRSYAANSALSSLAASNRFHPYGKPGGAAGLGSAIPPTLGLGALGLPPSLPPSLAGLGAGAAAAAAYNPASLYASLYGSRLAGGSLP